MKVLSLSAAIAAYMISLTLLVSADLSRIVSVNTQNHQMLDAQGRSRFFHGTNLVIKSAPYSPNTETFVAGRSVVQKDIDTLKALNINSIRLGVHWAGVEPVTRGVYDMAYVAKMKGIVDLLATNGIYALIDMHQDVLSAQTCGHGVPPWFVKQGWVIPSHMMPVPQKSSPFPVDANGIPSDADCNSIDWSVSYLNYAVGNAFGRLYNNYDNLGDAWASYWKLLATTFNGHPGVQGYDLMNEPWVGDHMADPTLLIPGKADGINLEPLWNKGTAAIRTVDNSTLIYFEGSTYDILNGFNNVPGGDPSKTVHSFHYYNPPQLGSIETTIQNRIKDINRHGGAHLLSEFTFWMGDQKQMDSILEGCRQADRYLLSWQGWAYENLWDGSTGLPHPELARNYARTYTEATAGEATSFYFQDSTTKYWVQWKANPSITAPGLIRIAPQIYYPDGIRVFFTPPNAGSFTMDGPNTVQLFYNQTNVTPGQLIQVSVQPFLPTDVIKNPTSGKCLDNGNGYTTEGNPIILWTCASSANQVWKLKDGTIQLAFDGQLNSGLYCLDTSTTVVNPGTDKELRNVVLNKCVQGKASQQWSVDGVTGQIKNGVTGHCVDVNGSNYKDGTQILTYKCGNGQANQAWTLPRGTNDQW